MRKIMADVLLVLGFASFVAGIAIVSVPAAMVVGGAMAMAAAVRMAQ